MDKKHTPLPWEVCESANSNFIHIETPLENPHGAGIQIATLNRGNKETRLANASLIVTAVNNYERMREALRELFELHLDATGEEKRKSKEDIEDYYRRIEKRVKAILAETEGK